MLKMDRAKAKWRIKLQKAFEGQRQCSFILVSSSYSRDPIPVDVDAGAKSGKWVLFVLPLITVLREGECRPIYASLSHRSTNKL